MLGAQASGSSEPPPGGLRAPLFEQLIRGLDADRRHVIVDLGTARSGTIALFAGLRCRLDVIDLHAALPGLLAQPEPELRQQQLGEQLDRVDDEPCDLVLSWNLLNYLPVEDIRWLVARLGPRLAPAARLHTLIEYSSPLMPATPGYWIPDRSARLHADQVDLDQISSPRHSPRALERLMPAFEAERSVLLGNGLQEHVFRLRG